MALTRTTLSSACGAGDTKISLTALTGLLAGMVIKCDGELMLVTSAYAGVNPVAVIRAQQGTYASAHPITAGVIFGLASDEAWSTPAPQTVTQFPMVRARLQASYSAAGAIANPTPGSDLDVFLNSTVALAMTISAPSVDQDGDVMTIIGNGEAAHTVTYTGGFGGSGAGYTIATFTTGGQNAVVLKASNGVWVLLSPMTGTLTVAVPAIS
jgi:hypothetical protein